MWNNWRLAVGLVVALIPLAAPDVQEQTAAGLRISGNENDRRVVGEWYSEMPTRSDTPLTRSNLAAT